MSIDKTKVQEVAFQIVAYAGDAFDHFNNYINLCSEGKFDEAETEMKEGTDSLNKAHQCQTDLLVAEARSEDSPYSLLMVHAQDHLTMAIFSQRMAKQFGKLWKEVKHDE